MTEFDSPVAKVLAVLADVARNGTTAASAVAERLRLPVSTVHRIASELERLGYLQRAPGTRDWMVAAPTIDIAVDTLTASAALAKPQAILRETSEQLGEMCTLGVRRADEVVYVASVEPQKNLALSFRAGRRAPLHCTSSGRLFLAREDDATIADYLASITLTAYTPMTVTDPHRLAKIIRRIREQGYAVTSQEYVLHIAGAAVPIVGADGTMYGTLGVTAPEVRTGSAKLRTLVPALKAAALRLARCFGEQPPERLAKSA
ncbi:MAG: IclR family transcriptional regulator [Alphaproteobacteria bacterium]